MLRRSLIVGAVACSFGLAGCGTSTQEDRRTALPDSPEQVVDFLRQTATFDYDPLPSPESLRRNVDFAGLGSVQSVTSATIEGGPESLGAVIVSLRIDETWKSSPELAGSGLVRFALRRPTNVPATTFRNSLPVGTQIAVFGYLSTLDISPATLAPVLEPAPQGLLIGTSSARLSNVWGEDENDTMVGWREANTIQGIRSTLAPCARAGSC